MIWLKSAQLVIKKTLPLFVWNNFIPGQKKQLQKVIKRFPNAEEYLWVQEEPKNMGGWMFVNERFRDLVGAPLHYIGRSSSASPAAGSLSQYKREQFEILQKSFGKVLDINKNRKAK